MNVRWHTPEFGAPEIDPKRPYGNSSVLEDIREITELEQELWQMRRWAADRRRDIKRELEEMRHNLEDAEFSEKILE